MHNNLYKTNKSSELRKKISFVHYRKKNETRIWNPQTILICGWYVSQDREHKKALPQRIQRMTTHSSFRTTKINYHRQQIHRSYYTWYDFPRDGEERSGAMRYPTAAYKTHWSWSTCNAFISLLVIAFNSIRRKIISVFFLLSFLNSNYIYATFSSHPPCY